VSEKWGFGVALNSISGAALDYENHDDFVGRYWAQKIDLLTITVAPSIAFRISDKVAVSFGVPIVLGNIEMDVAIPAPTADGIEGLAEISDGEDIVVGGTLGLLWDVSERSRIGLTYVSEVEFDFDSDLKLTLPGGGATLDDIDTRIEIPLAQTIRLSASHDISDKTTLLATLAWEDWSALDSLLISTDAGGGALVRNWDDTWRYALGARFRTDGRWTWYTGVAYDTDPASDATRTADMPIDRQIRVSGGATFDKSDKVTLGGALTYIDLGDGGIDNGGIRPVSGTPWTVQGEYDTNRILFVGFNLNWR
jgi:long-chain fatty acid transport protein